ncbi:tetratricopeptide repeat protein [Polynucleobacter sp. MWH-UH23A]|uniref:tetratricopeptide repeat-containing glycosyltransferase family protein n=1 Tax=Polynucleobacter sp. MWH-UH23A TaxID=1855613 RepID=UPI003364F112
MNHSLEHLIGQAVQSFQNGDLNHAENQLKLSLDVYPNNPPGIHILGLVYAAQNRHNDAIKYLSLAAEFNPTDPSIQYNLGKAFASIEDHPSALKHQQKSIELDPRNPAAYLNYANSLSKLSKNQAALDSINQALALQNNYLDAIIVKGSILNKLGDYSSSLDCSKSAIQLDANSSEAWLNQGVSLYNIKQFNAALDSFDKALTINPKYVNALINKGVTLNDMGRFSDGCDVLTMALKLSPNSLDAHYNLGLTLHGLKLHQDALDSFNKAIALKPDYAEAWLNKGVALNNLRRYQDALDSFNKAIALKPDYAEAWSNLGATYFESVKDFDLAMNAYRKALAFKPNYPEAHYNIAAAHHELRQFNLAQDSYNLALNLKPDYPDAQWNKSLIYLTLGDYETGWPLYESRWNTSNSPLPNTYSEIPRLKPGVNIEGKKILIWSEQGLGDSIQFSRYIKLLKSQGANITFLAAPQLISLFHSSFDIEISSEIPRPLSQFDYQSPLMSLPYFFGSTLSSIPNQVPYLLVDQNKRSYWNDKLKGFDLLKVGLVWSGGFRPNQPEVWQINERRNISLETISSLRFASNVEFFSLQKGDPAETELREQKNKLWPQDNLRIFTDELKDFSDTAALIANLDLIISVDTSTAHLSAALGKPTWLLNRFDSCWRWLNDRVESPWYPSIKLYNQKQSGNWGPVMQKVMSDLESLTLKK